MHFDVLEVNWDVFLNIFIHIYITDGPKADEKHYEFESA